MILLGSSYWTWRGEGKSRESRAENISFLFPEISQSTWKRWLPSDGAVLEQLETQIVIRTQRREEQTQPGHTESFRSGEACVCWAWRMRGTTEWCLIGRGRVQSWHKRWKLTYDRKYTFDTRIPFSLVSLTVPKIFSFSLSFSKTIFVNEILTCHESMDTSQTKKGQAFPGGKRRWKGLETRRHVWRLVRVLGCRWVELRRQVKSRLWDPLSVMLASLDLWGYGRHQRLLSTGVKALEWSSKTLIVDFF